MFIDNSSNQSSKQLLTKTIEKIDGLVEKDYEELINRFVKEQPALLEFAGFIKHENSKKFFDAFFDLMIIIWMAFEDVQHISLSAFIVADEFT